MKRLGVTVDSLDAIAISHPHCDHTGGMPAMRAKTFMLSPSDLDLTGLTAYVPSPLSHPTANVVLTEEPKVIFPGVATIGVIWRALWLLGLTPSRLWPSTSGAKGSWLSSGVGIRDWRGSWRGPASFSPSRCMACSVVFTTRSRPPAPRADRRKG